MKKLLVLFFVFYTYAYAKDFVPFLSFSSSKSALMTIYSKHKVLPLSGLSYVFSDKDCSAEGYVMLNGEAEKILWRMLIPEELFGKGMLCMEEKICFSTFSKRYHKGPMCCRRKSEKFRKMSSDMHHIIPTINREYEKNLLEIDEVSDKGMIARAILYMYDTYQLDIDEKIIKQARDWHKVYPVSAWDKQRNKKIFELQGTFNSYIEKL
jgi:deoxyribonuclease I